MARYVVVYASREGQTRSVAERVAEELRAQAHDADAFDHRAAEAEAAVAHADAVVLAGSVHMGRIHDGLARFSERCAVPLSGRPSALIVVCLTASKHGPEAEATMQGYVAAFLRATTWKPDVVEFVAGALRPSRLGFLRRTLVTFLSRQEGRPVPPEGVEFTDWEAVQRFARTLSAWFPRVGVATRAPRRAPRA
jgi:menaquinone-dependent protoporphyrinogen oxidase